MLLGIGIQVSDGAQLSTHGCEVSGCAAVGILVSGRGSDAVLQDSSIVATRTSTGAQGMLGLGLAVQGHATAWASELHTHSNEGPGLHAASSGRLECRACTVTDNSLAGAVSIAGGDLKIDNSTITGTREAADLGGGVGLYAAKQGTWDAPTLRVSSSLISGNQIAGAFIANEGSYAFSETRFTDNIAVAHGATTRCGNGLYASSVHAWDGSEGLLLIDNTVSDNEGAGAFLDDAAAMLVDNHWAQNQPDLLVRGEACLEPREDYAEAPHREVCPTWHQPSCQVEFHLTLNVADLDPAALPPSRAVVRPAVDVGLRPRPLLLSR